MIRLCECVCGTHPSKVCVERELEILITIPATASHPFHSITATSPARRFIPAARAEVIQMWPIWHSRVRCPCPCGGPLELPGKWWQGTKIAYSLLGNDKCHTLGYEWGCFASNWMTSKDAASTGWTSTLPCYSCEFELAKSSNYRSRFYAPQIQACF